MPFEHDVYCRFCTCLGVGILLLLGGEEFGRSCMLIILSVFLVILSFALACCSVHYWLCPVGRSGTFSQ